MLTVGVLLVAASAYARRYVSPELALVGVFDGVLLGVVGAIGFVHLSSVETLAASQPPIGRAWYGPPTLGVGLATLVGSLAVGRWRWPERPRYAGLGMVLGLWVAYPVLVPSPLTNPLGSLLAVATPVAVGYVVWTDASDLLSDVLADRAAKWFGAGIGFAASLLFGFSMGMVTFSPDPGGANLTEDFVTTARVADPLVYWPAVEFHLHDAIGTTPVSGVLSVGTVLLVGLLAALVGLNAALFAARWRATPTDGRAGTAAGSAAIAAPTALCFCGPAIAGLVAASMVPEVAAPVYWLFADLASPVGALFFATSVALLTGNLVRASMKGV
ncbi:hypothetical protein [Halorussus amylolyticus]|uniref:hypothetical protein n=1 Tax=Halorussus amylolyticus TaxID=1126242 RepID=UPI00138F864C|nr:hypothetical protein [Halorussus amylolyticus]